MSFTDPAGFLRGARHLPDLPPDVAFLITPKLIYGSWRKAEPGDLRHQIEKLCVPRLVQRGWARPPWAGKRSWCVITTRC